MHNNIKLMKLFIKLSIIISTIWFNKAFGQFSQDNICFSNIFINRPLLDCDSSAIIDNNISKIKLFESNYVEDNIPIRILIGEWKISIENKRIKSAIWTSFYKDSLSYDNHYCAYVVLRCFPLIKRDIKKSKIIDIIGDQYYEILLTHLISKFGKIYQTNIKATKGIRMEDSTYLFHKIEYKYLEDFMIEAEYFSYDLIGSEYSPFYILYYEYEK